MNLKTKRDAYSYFIKSKPNKTIIMFSCNFIYKSFIQFQNASVQKSMPTLNTRIKFF